MWQSFLDWYNWLTDREVALFSFTLSAILMPLLIYLINLLISILMWKETLLWIMIKRLLINIKSWVSRVYKSLIGTFKHGASYWYNFEKTKWVVYWLEMREWRQDRRFNHKLYDIDWNLVESSQEVRRINLEHFIEYLGAKYKSLGIVTSNVTVENINQIQKIRCSLRMKVNIE